MSNRNLYETAVQNCSFCGIASGSTLSYSVFNDSTCFAFLDKRPVFEGHCLLIPLKHCETLADLHQDLVVPLFRNAQLISAAVQEGMKAEGTFVAINNRISQSVPHLHIHIVPRRHGDGLRGFFWPRRTYATEKEALAARDAIVTAISRTKLR